VTDKAKQNLRRVPGLFLRVPLLCLAYYVMQPAVKGIEWLCENYLKGLER
jgi:hypothetical protein